MDLLRLKCPVCHSSAIHYHSPYTTKNHGGRVIYKCEHCPAYFSETKNTFLEGLKTPVSVIWHVLKARTEGMGLNAAARTFEKAKNTILAWERKFLDLQQVLFLYALVHEFFEVVIEGDEAYTKVQKNVPPDQSRGWTILLMDRASRFIWALDCGKKDRRLFQKAIKTLDKIARQTHDLSIFTDGERRYGNLLFEICHELVHNGKPGRPKKTFKKGVHVRLKNKGAQAGKFHRPRKVGNSFIGQGSVFRHCPLCRSLYLRLWFHWRPCVRLLLRATRARSVPVLCRSGVRSGLCLRACRAQSADDYAHTRRVPASPDPLAHGRSPAAVAERS